jgi:hypothetical protein
MCSPYISPWWRTVNSVMIGWLNKIVASMIVWLICRLPTCRMCSRYPSPWWRTVVAPPTSGTAPSGTPGKYKFRFFSYSYRLLVNLLKIASRSTLMYVFVVNVQIMSSTHGKNNIHGFRLLSVLSTRVTGMNFHSISKLFDSPFCH